MEILYFINNTLKIVSLTKLQSISDNNVKYEIKISVFLLDKNLQSNIAKKSYIFIEVWHKYKVNS